MALNLNQEEWPCREIELEKLTTPVTLLKKFIIWFMADQCILDRLDIRHCLSTLVQNSFNE